MNGQKGTPDFTIVNDFKNIIIVVECKEKVEDHQFVENLDEYTKGIGSVKDITKYAINGALHYANFVNYKHDVIAIGISGTTEKNIRISSILLPKGKTYEDIKVLEDGDYFNSIMTYEEYEREINIKLGRNQEDIEQVKAELKKYASACNNYLRINHISAKDRAGFISAIVLALTEESSLLYKLTKLSMPDTKEKKPFIDEINERAISELKESLRIIWTKKDKVPEIKRMALDEYYGKILINELNNKPEGTTKYFKYGENILSSCIFSVYENIVLKIKNYNNIDIMGTFYTAFLKYAKGDTKDKGIVLTPSHISELFCDIAEIYLEEKLNENTIVLDCCCGTGGFLIGALNRMDNNINSKLISENEKKRKRRKVRKECLIGVEREPEMFALAYANMRFHGDGRSNLYCCSSLLKDFGVAKLDEEGNVITLEEEGNVITLEEELKKMKRKPKVGMINPPYSLLSINKKKVKNKNESNDKQTGQTELDFVYSMLEYLDEKGIGIAIVPMNCASSKNDKMMRKRIMEKHTLLAVMTMPSKLFKNSEVDAMTCIMVFRAHKPHEESNKIVFLSRWIDDGFVIVQHSGRYDKNFKWIGVKGEWLMQLKGMAKENNSMYLRRELNSEDEWLAEAYVETDYSKLTEEVFENHLKKFALYKYMQENIEVE